MRVMTSAEPIAPQPSVSQKHSQWFLATRVIVVAIALTTVAIFLIAIPVAFHRFLMVCNNPQKCQLTPDLVRSLKAMRLSPTFYAGYLVALNSSIAFAYVLLAALLFWRRSEDRVALLAALTFVTFGGAAFTSDITQSLAATNSVWYGIVNALDLIGQVSFVSLFSVFPDGRFVPRWTPVIIGMCGVYWFLNLYLPWASMAVDSATGGLLFIALVATTIVAQVYRYRRVSTTLQRQQTKWVVSGYVAGLGGFIALIVVGNVLPLSLSGENAAVQLLATTCVYMCILLIPISIAVAILRSHLWDIDILINRALVYGSLTAILATMYFGIVFGVQHLTTVLTGNQGRQESVVIVLTTLIIAALFQPLRSRIQRTIDQRFYRRKYDTAKTIERFAATLRQQVELDQLNNHLLTTIEETMQPTHVSLWLLTPGVNTERRK